jgi:AraC-like DNA-binding protein
MKKVLFLKLNTEMLKLMSECGLRSDDYKYVRAYEEYQFLRAEGQKADVILMEMAQRYRVSESTLKRAFRRLSGEVTA